MAKSRVIQDSDDDDGSVSIGNSPLYTPAGALSRSNEVGVALVQNGTGSTDPVLFQQIYDEHLAGAKNISDHRRPVIGHPPVDDSISSPVSRKKLKRSKTINASSLTSVSEPTTSVRKAKRSKSMKDVEDLTQVTTPRPRNLKEKDPWEFPGGSFPDQLSNSSAVAKDRKVQRNGGLKTYGRPIRRSQTLAEVQSSPSDDWVPPSRVEEDVSQARVPKRSTRSCGDDDLLPMLPKPKRQKRSLSTFGEMFNDRHMEPFNGHQSQDAQFGQSTLNTTLESFTIQVPRSTSEEPHLRLHHELSAIVDNSMSAAEQVNGDGIINIVEPATTFEASVSSVAIIHNNLTNSQKLQYDAVSITSTVESRRCSLPHMMDPVDLALKYTGGSSTIPNDTPMPKPSSGSVQISKSPIPPSLSPPDLSSNDGTIVRDEIASNVLISSSVLVHHNDSKRKRSKTMTFQEVPPHRESSIDELSLVHLVPFEGLIKAAPPSKNGRKKTTKEEVSVNELFNTSDSGLPKEPYQPQSSLRRSKSTSTQNVDVCIKKPKMTRTKSAKSASIPNRNITVSSLSETAEQERLIQDHLVPSLKSDSVEDETGAKKAKFPKNDTSTVHTAAENESSLAAPVEAQTMRQGRLRKSEMNVQKSVEDPVTKPTDSVATANTVLEVNPTLFHEKDSDRQLSQDPLNTASWSRTADFILAKTPTRTFEEISISTLTPMKGPTQHSPLQCSKVSYRVGLSKRTRIAPLLKIIKK